MYELLGNLGMYEWLGGLGMYGLLGGLETGEGWRRQSGGLGDRWLPSRARGRREPLRERLLAPLRLPLGGLPRPPARKQARVLLRLVGGAEGAFARQHAVASGGGERARPVDRRVPVLHHGGVPPQQDGVHAPRVAACVAIDHVAEQLKVPAVLAVDHGASADQAGDLAEPPVLAGVAGRAQVENAESIPAPDPVPLHGVRGARGGVQGGASSLAAEGAEVADEWARGQPATRLHRGGEGGGLIIVVKAVFESLRSPRFWNIFFYLTIEHNRMFLGTYLSKSTPPLTS